MEYSSYSHSTANVVSIPCQLGSGVPSISICRGGGGSVPVSHIRHVLAAFVTYLRGFVPDVSLLLPCDPSLCRLRTSFTSTDSYSALSQRSQGARAVGQFDKRCEARALNLLLSERGTLVTLTYLLSIMFNHELTKAIVGENYVDTSGCQVPSPLLRTPC